MKKYLFYLLLLSFFTLCVTSISKAQADTTYIGSFKQNFSAKVYTAYDFTSLTRQHAEYPAEIYLPHVPPYIGLGASWKERGVSLSYGFAFLNPNEKNKRSHYLDLQYHSYGKRFVFDFFGQIYKGFSIQKDINQRFHTDIRLLQFGGFFQYNFNHKHFSYPAVFDQSEKQLKSAGTPLVGLALYYTRVDADSLFIEEKVNYKYHYLFGPSAGYAYTWVFKKNYFATGSFSLGINTSFDGLNRKFGYCPTIFPRISSGYNAENWSISISAQYNLVYMTFTNTDKLGIGTLNGQITFIRRFNFKSKLLDKVTFQK